MRGEGLGEVVTLEEINRFLKIEKSNLNDTVESLVEMGYLKLSTNSENISEVQLSEQGKKEGKIRYSGLSKGKGVDYKSIVDLNHFDFIQDDINLLYLKPILSDFENND